MENETPRRGRPRKTLAEETTTKESALASDGLPFETETAPAKAIEPPKPDPLEDTAPYRFLVNDAQQAYNVQKLRRRCKEFDWKGQLKSGHTYTLPHCVARWINTLGYPTYQQVTRHDGTVETVQAGWIQRFSCIPA